MRTHHSIYDAILLKDEERDSDRHKDLKKDKLTLTECILALLIALACVSLHAVFLGMSEIITIGIFKSRILMTILGYSGRDRLYSRGGGCKRGILGSGRFEA